MISNPNGQSAMLAHHQAAGPAIVRHQAGHAGRPISKPLPMHICQTIQPGLKSIQAICHQDQPLSPGALFHVKNPHDGFGIVRVTAQTPDPLGGIGKYPPSPQQPPCQQKPPICNCHVKVQCDNTEIVLHE